MFLDQGTGIILVNLVRRHCFPCTGMKIISLSLEVAYCNKVRCTSREFVSTYDPGFTRTIRFFSTLYFLLSLLPY